MSVTHLRDDELPFARITSSAQLAERCSRPLAGREASICTNSPVLPSCTAIVPLRAPRCRAVGTIHLSGQEPAKTVALLLDIV